MEKTIKTALWQERTFSLFRVFARDYKFGIPTRNKEVGNFVQFFEAYPKLDLRGMLSLCSILNMYTGCFNAETRSMEMENSCMFSTADGVDALDVVLENLESPKHSWVFLDSEQKAVVHFVNKKGYYAELYCLASENSSALHVVTCNEKKCLIPVVFGAESFFERYRSEANAAGENYLRQYLPRDEYDFLRKKGPKNCSKPSDSGTATGRHSDGGEFL